MGSFLMNFDRRPFAVVGAVWPGLLAGLSCECCKGCAEIPVFVPLSAVNESGQGGDYFGVADLPAARPEFRKVQHVLAFRDVVQQPVERLALLARAVAARQKFVPACLETFVQECRKVKKLRRPQINVCDWSSGMWGYTFSAESDSGGGMSTVAY